MWAVFYQYPEATHCLLEHHANPNIPVTKDYSSIPAGSTPIMVCAYYGLDELATALLKAGANPEHVNSKGKKALDYAVEFNFESTIQLLKPTPKPKPVPKPEPVPTPVPTEPKAVQEAPRTEPKPSQPPKKAEPKKPAKKKTEPKSEPPGIK